MADLKYDIERYLRGELSPAEMHALEKKALSDPFLADALEGASHLNAPEFESDMQDLQASLQNRLAEQRNNKKTVPLWVWTARIAAGLLLVALSTFVILNLIGTDKHTSDIAQVNEGSAPTPPEEQALLEDTSTSEESEEADKDITDEKLSLATPEETKPQAPVTKPESRTAITHEQEASATVETQPAISSIPEPLAKSDAPPTAADTVILHDVVIAREGDRNVAQSAPQGFASGADKKKEARDDGYTRESERRKAATEAPAAAYRATPNVIRGQVTSSDDGKGLPGVNVIIKGTNTGTVTDAEGYYQITSNQSNTSLVFSFIGLESKEVDATSNKPVDVQMDADVAQLSEVVVTGYGTERLVTEDNTTTELAAPSGGRKAFKQYLEQNLRYPEQAIENNVEGRVTVQFTVETNGKLSDFKVIKGLGYGCDEEVIRLIRQGPAWSPSKSTTEPVRDKVKVRLRFSLPKK